MLYGNRKIFQSFSQNMIKGLLKNKTLKIAYDKIDSPTYSKDAARALISCKIKEAIWFIPFKQQRQS